jgi:elongation factor 1-gamma
MTKSKVYGNGESFRTQKVLATSKIAKKEVEVVAGKPSADKYPLGLTPVLEEGDKYVFGAAAISKHLANGTQLVPKGSESEVDQWLLWGESQLVPNVLSYVLPSVSAANVDAKVVGQAKDELLAQLAVFDKWLLSRTFLVGERLSVADVSVAFDLLPAFQHVLDESARSKLVNVTRWFQTVVHNESVKSVLGGEVKLISKASTFNADAFKKLSASAQPKKEEKKAEKPAKSSKKQDDDEEEEPSLEPKFVDPFAAMPAGKFNMDAFKRVYSNEDTATKAIPWFWENFDPENYSIWYGEYKYPEDLSVVFMSCNLISGMFQRLDKMRKHAFGSVCLFGTDNNSTISGIWVWRGHDLAFELSPDWQVDYESYAWKKLDPKDESTKKTVNEYLLWEGDFDGKKFNQGKIFK